MQSLRRAPAQTTTPHRARATMPRRPSLAVARAAAAPAATIDATAAAPRGQDDFAAFERFVVAAQDAILREAESIDGGGKTFLRDRWERTPPTPGAPGGGYGVTAVLEGGDLLEKAAANITVIRGVLSPQRAQAMSSRGRGSVDPAGGQRYGAAALSLVFHPRHPRVPTLRADVRLFQVFADDGKKEEEEEGDASFSSSSPPLSWYGGGCDLTPALLFEEDARAFHQHWKNVCDAHHPVLYEELKPWCDRYFYVTARREHRGVGGIFFDDLERPTTTTTAATAGAQADADAAALAAQSGEGAPRSFAAARKGEFDPASFSRDVLGNVLPSWRDIAQRRRREPVIDSERTWQLQRRARYLEFNLLDDRGVKFGLADGNGRVESIMVSAPPLIAWNYNVVPPAGSREEATLELLRGKPREWA